MKNLSLVFIVILISLLNSCQSKKENNLNPQPKDLTVPMSLEELNSGQSQKIVEIDLVTARIMAREFTRIAAERLQSNNQDTIEKCVLFPKSTMLAILNSIPDNGYLGIYLGNYKVHNDAVSNYLQNNGTQMDFRKYTGKFSVILAKINAQLMVEQTLTNLGGLCPPDCGTGNVRSYLHND